MKRIVVLMLAVLILLGAMAACDTPTPEVPEQTTEQSTEQPTEQPTEPVIEIPEDAVPIADVVQSLAPDAEVMQTNRGVWQVILPTDDIEATQVSLMRSGYAPVEVALIQNATMDTRVFYAEQTLLTLQKTASSLYLIWESFDADMLPLLSPNTATATGIVTMAQVGVEREEEDDNPNIGMCYVYKLSDGSAVIIDGGFPTDSCATNLYSTLQKLNVAKDDQGRFRITAWLITHGHKDHRGTMNRFGKLYGEQVSLSYIMMNFPLGELSTSTFDVPAYQEKMDTHYPGVRYIAPHAGLQYHFDNLTLQILYSPEMIYAPDQPITYYNNSSLIFISECAGARVLHMGDAGEDASAAAWAAYDRKAFAADVLQITHHGMSTGTDSHKWKNIKQIYAATGAELGLLPIGSRLEGNERNGRHTVLFGHGGGGYHVSFIINKKDNHGVAQSAQQDYYNQFVADVAAGTSEYKTLWGYDGINTVTNAQGMVTYLSCNETTPMVTLFTLSADGARVELNQELYTWFE